MELDKSMTDKGYFRINWELLLQMVSVKKIATKPFLISFSVR